MRSERRIVKGVGVAFSPYSASGWQPESSVTMAGGGGMRDGEVRRRPSQDVYL